MPEYRVESGALDTVIETPFPAKPQAIATMAFCAHPTVEPLGLLTKISGGEFEGQQAIYVGTASVLADMGKMPRAGA